MNTPAFDPTLYCTHEQVDLLWEKEVNFSWLQSPLNKGFWGKLFLENRFIEDPKVTELIPSIDTHQKILIWFCFRSNSDSDHSPSLIWSKTADDEMKS